MKNINLIISVATLVVVALLISACGDDSPPMGPTGGGNATVPAAPSDLEASQRSQTTVLLNWQDNSDDETGFRIERSLSPGSGFNQVNSAGGDATSYTVSNLSAATTYYFRVCAYNAAGNSSFTTTVQARTLDRPTQPPAAPSHLQATNPTQTSVLLEWHDNSNNEDGFKVEQSLSRSSGFTVVKTFAAGTTARMISNLTAGTTYYFRVYAYNSAGSSTRSNTADVTTLSDPPPPQQSVPVLSGPSSAVTDGQHFLLEWTYDWASCTFCPSTSGYQLEESSTSASSGFDMIWSSYNTQDRESPKKLTISPRSAGTYWYRVRAYDNGWSDYSNVVQVTVEALVSSTRFVNNTSYIIVSLKINGQEQFPVSPMGILPGRYYELELSPGTYTVTAANGFWDVSGRFTLYTWSGQFTQQSGVTGEVRFADPTIQQLLAKFTSSGYWQGSYWAGTNLYFAGFRFFSNGNFDFYNNGTKTGSGRYSLVSRNPGAFTVDFTVGSYQGTLYETLGYFAMPNGQQPTPWIQYFYEGTAATPEGGPIDVPLQVSIVPSIER